MPRMRSLKPEFWLDRKLARQLSRDERMLYLGLWNQADEWARANGDLRVVQGQIFPYDEDITLDVLDTMLKALEVARVVVRYESDGDPYLFLPKLAKHQRLEPHKVPSRHPAPPEQPADQQVQTPPAPEPDSSARDSDPAQTSSRGIRAKHVAGSREHVAGVHGPDKSAPTPPPEQPNTTSRRKPRRPLPDDFTITAEMRTWHRGKGVSDHDADRQTERFKANALAKDVRFVDWSQGWRNWIDQALEWGQIRARPLGVVADGGTAGPSLTAAQIDDVLGPDVWTAPPPPDDLDPAVDHARFKAWHQQVLAEHRADRVRRAHEVLERRVLT